MGSFDVKTALDMGLGAAACVLFFQQSRILQGVRLLVADLERRVGRLEEPR